MLVNKSDDERLVDVTYRHITESTPQHGVDAVRGALWCDVEFTF